MKISFLEPHLLIYGGIRRIIEFANRLTARGHDVTIYHPKGGPCDWMTCAARIKSSPELLKEPHDVIVFNDPNPVDFALVSDADARLKVFYVLELYEKHLLEGFDPRLLLGRNSHMRILKRCLRSFQLILANATWEKEWLRKNMGIGAELVFGGINTELFHPVDVARQEGRTIVLASGDPRPRKGMDTITQAVDVAKRAYQEVVLETYHNKGLPQEEMAELYSSADIFVEASWQAGWNNPVAEAMACGVPVVCTDIGGVADFAFHERTALLVPPKDPDAMASAITRLLDDRDLGEKLRANALEHILTFDWDDAVTRLEAILESRLEQ
jgi:glycosyltransferase involved in cell wall biosynthesis